MTIKINDLSVELLLQIFQYSDINSLCKLRQCCKRFNAIISNYKIPLQEHKALVTNQFKNSIKSRSFILLSPYEKWRISHNWKIGRYKSLKLLKQRKKYMPWLILDKELLWISQGKFVKAFRRRKNNVLIEDTPIHNVNNGTNDDIVRFRLKDNYIISGLRNGGLWIYSLEENAIIYNCSQCHFADVTDVDLTREIFVSCSSDQTFSIWPFKFNNESLRPLHNQDMYDKIWCLEISPFKKFLAIGTAGFHGIPPFHVYDLERCHVKSRSRQILVNGAGTLDLHWEDENVVITCGYDTYLRKWDLRTGNCEQIWEDPHDSALYCVASDDLYTLITGTISYGRVVLWDQRVYNKYVQLYYTCSSSCLNTSSPVYSVAFDSCQLFTALDRCVTCLDFTNYRGKVKNYEDGYLSAF